MREHRLALAVHRDVRDVALKEEGMVGCDFGAAGDDADAGQGGPRLREQVEGALDVPEIQRCGNDVGADAGDDAKQAMVVQGIRLFRNVAP